MNATEIIDLMEAEVARRGYRISAGAWFDHAIGMGYAFSVESYGPGTYGHPRCTVSYSVRFPDGLAVSDNGCGCWVPMKGGAA